MITVCTTFSPSGYRQYGQKFLETFDKYWPVEVSLLVYTEEHIEVSRGACKNFWLCDGAQAFYDRHKDNGQRTGVLPTKGWRQKDRVEGYSWRFDAVKFFRQCLVPYDVSRTIMDGDILIWLDADVVTFDDVPLDFLEDLIKGTDLVFFGRGSYHSEIGFWAVRMCKAGRAMVRDLANLYVTDQFLDLKEHHSAFVFDHVRNNTYGLRTRNVTPSGSGGHGGHVWLNSPMAKYTDHLKGSRRKRMGYSADHPIRWWKK